jgi:hypothetical protein
LINS